MNPAMSVDHCQYIAFKFNIRISLVGKNMVQLIRRYRSVWQIIPAISVDHDYCQCIGSSSEQSIRQWTELLSCRPESSLQLLSAIP